MPNTVTHKLELFEEAILAKAAAERQEAEQVTERMKKAELDKEENRLLNGLYQQIQDQIHQMQTENVKEISRNARDLKKQLYQQREQYLAEIIARARAELAVFSNGPDYPACRTGQVGLRQGMHSRWVGADPAWRGSAAQQGPRDRGGPDPRLRAG